MYNKVIHRTTTTSAHKKHGRCKTVNIYVGQIGKRLRETECFMKQGKGGVIRECVTVWKDNTDSWSSEQASEEAMEKEKVLDTDEFALRDGHVDSRFNDIVADIEPAKKSRRISMSDLEEDITEHENKKKKKKHKDGEQLQNGLKAGKDGQHEQGGSDEDAAAAKALETVEGMSTAKIKMFGGKDAVCEHVIQNQAKKGAKPSAAARKGDTKEDGGKPRKQLSGRGLGKKLVEVRKTLLLRILSWMISWPSARA